MFASKSWKFIEEIMKFSISYKFKLKMAQNLSGRSRAGRGRSGPVGAGRCRSGPVGAGAASASSAGADRCRCRLQTTGNAVVRFSKNIKKFCYKGTYVECSNENSGLCCKSLRDKLN